LNKFFDLQVNVQTHKVRITVRVRKGTRSEWTTKLVPTLMRLVFRFRLKTKINIC